eukprot:COSAG05_NODE_355_length_10856_cov_7.197174_13_plen_38_part_00
MAVVLYNTPLFLKSLSYLVCAILHRASLLMLRLAASC